MNELNKEIKLTKKEIEKQNKVFELLKNEKEKQEWVRTNLKTNKILVTKTLLERLIKYLAIINEIISWWLSIYKNYETK